MAVFVYEPTPALLAHLGNARTLRGVTFMAGEPVDVGEQLAAKLRCLADFRDVTQDADSGALHGESSTSMQPAVDGSDQAPGKLARKSPEAGSQSTSPEDPTREEAIEARTLEFYPDPRAEFVKRKRGRPPGSKNKPRTVTNGNAHEG